MGDLKWAGKIENSKQPPFSIQGLHDYFFWQTNDELGKGPISVHEAARFMRNQWFPQVSNAYAREIYGL